ncbi:MAG TPA: protein phosphatase 2C domain-containing protein [Rhodocyclaceae bacterium]|nr:protein phosphatase 2C domain-containing protein [Rhodocyclaceae bacterium]
MIFSIAQDSRIGGRSVNQDRAAWYATSDAVLMIVADGMGGHLQGEVAAQIAVDTVTNYFRRVAKPRLLDSRRFLKAALNLAHESIVRYADECKIPAHVAPRTTCIACVVQNGMAHWAHAGDSRLYLIHGKGSTASTEAVHTRDHSMVQRLLDEGRLSPAEIATHPLRHHVFSCLGGDQPPQVDVADPVALADGDVIALCTDGLWAVVDEQLPRRLRWAPLDTTVPQLLDSAAAAAGESADNLTLIAMRWQAPDPDAITVCESLAPSSGRVSADDLPISDDEIDQAVLEIQRRLSPN